MPHQQSSGQHLTVSQVAARLAITEDHLRRSILGQPDGIRALKLGNGPRAQWRVRVCDLEAWEEAKLVCYDAAPRPRRH
ncbi:hypothetical protein [Nitrospira defluvii]|uniref:Helix-turn-helix domain-containing protein n=1 Tax=Nitrospira defluvii TaxID=330214 RepID=A0ABM8RZ22_9BACT|nr:hypothetical protein [Nitrospira defluvii]CAE6779649.1 conserved hypothetical protein [Nitrospira defluvii]